ncbi:armadillo-type protein [Neohortaea acidophila]|uniref:Armadillo-type protein n=1 Tax=Neohortaea acidophila TaxID=245834 RepID=A0A6A6Q2I5_9PEZI|nr:armadillo-type protein [Neohortaea acidophila]KAF2486209.1 armadillo-type protein [Neohortaea acidophila]
MSQSAVPANPSSHNVASLLPKLQDADSDIRYMTLNDLHAMLAIGSPTFMSHDYTTCAKVVDGLLHTLADTHGDVQNMAIKCLGPFVNKAPESILCPTIEKVSNIRVEGNLDNSIPALGVRAIVVALPQPVPGVQRSQKVNEAYSAVSKALIPRLVGKIIVPLSSGKQMPAPPKGMLQEDLETGNDSSSLDLLTEVARCFGPMLQDVEVQALEQITMEVLESDKCGSVMKKKAVAALSALSPYFNDELLAHHVTMTIEKLRSPHLTAQQRKLYITVYGSLAKSIPQKFGPYLKTLAPFVLAPLSESELAQQQEAEIEADGERDVQLEEVREAALIAVESFLDSCAPDMKMHAHDVLSCATRFLKYEPNIAEDEDEDMAEEQEDDEFDFDEDFEEETGFEDEDDVSWKVRRCSARVIHALIQTLDPNDPALFDLIAPALLSRFKEKEESVRTEVIATLAFLVTKVGSTTTNTGTEEHHEPLPPSRKRRRGLSESLDIDAGGQQAMNGYASPATPPPVDSATQGLAKINPEVVKGAAKLLKSSTVATKQVVLFLLKDMVSAQRGGLSGRADFVIEPVVDTLTSTNTSVSNLANNNLRIEALALLGVIAETHASTVLQPHLAKIVPALVSSAKDRYAKVSGQAFATIECFVKALTPPRSAASKKENAEHVAKIYGVVTERISANDTDTEVRQKAVRTLGQLIGRTAGPTGEKLLSKDDRYEGQQVIADRLRNELTRLPCVRAVEAIACYSQRKADYKPDFVGNVALELGAQLRKVSRSLRGASLSALRALTVNQASRECMDDTVVAQLVEMLVPLLRTDDLHMMSPALTVLAAFAKERPQLVATPQVIEGICSIVTSSISGVALDALIHLVEAIGNAGTGAGLMQALLNVGVHGDTDVTGQVIGTLLVSGGQNVGVTLDAFIKELQSQSEEAKKCLALSVLGEAGLRTGTNCPLTPESFTPYFNDRSEKVQLAAAVALGRAGAGDVKRYLPKILETMGQGKQYLLLHSVKELLQHNSAEDDIKPYTATLWNNIISSGQAEDNKVVGAECIGRLATIDAEAYLPQLQAFLKNSNPAIRGMVISALRYVFSDTDSSYNASLNPYIIPMLETMMADEDLENKRLSLSTFNSALHNKPDLVLPHLSSLLSYAMQATVPRPELIREVSMGPFKHKVDDGLEIRKSAYETMYALLDSPASRQRLDMVAYYDRISDGITDEHEIKMLCCLVLSKLLIIAPAESGRHLDRLATQFRAVLSIKPKENAVKQELEKFAEVNKAIIKVSLAFNKAISTNEIAGGGGKTWKDYFEWMKKDHPVLVKQAQEDEARDR